MSAGHGEARILWNSTNACRLTIAAVAATAAGTEMLCTAVGDPPHDCRSRGDCGAERAKATAAQDSRLTIAAVAATFPPKPPCAPDMGFPPHDCRSRGDCGRVLNSRQHVGPPRLTIAAVAATAAARSRRP